MGEIYLKLGHETEAITMFQTALKIDNKQVDSYLHLGRIHLAQKHIDEAIELFQAAVKVDPRYPEAVAWLEKAKAAAAGG
jgi:tetratricopeptide (TPR) repeat protein